DAFNTAAWAPAGRTETVASSTGSARSRDAHTQPPTAAAATSTNSSTQIPRRLRRTGSGSRGMRSAARSSFKSTMSTQQVSGPTPDRHMLPHSFDAAVRGAVPWYVRRMPLVAVDGVTLAYGHLPLLDRVSI